MERLATIADRDAATTSASQTPATHRVRHASPSGRNSATESDSRLFPPAGTDALRGD
jgi:hypothetical protein